MKAAASEYPLDFAYAQGEPPAQAWLKQSPDDFQVDECLGFELTGEGEHVYLQLQKRGLNTADLAKRIAELAGVKLMDVGYAGMKDRHAITTQWFSLYYPKAAEPDWRLLEQEQQVRLLSVKRHRQKLRRGQHGGNGFRIRLTQLSGDSSTLPERLRLLAEQGVPNYFGPQRFGIEGNNLAGADQLLVARQAPRSRRIKGIYLSAARAYLFNRLLSNRVVENSWRRLEAGDIPFDFNRGGLSQVPTGPLWGRGRTPASERIGELERVLSEEFAAWCNGLEHAGLKQERRPLCLPPEDFHWSLEEQCLELDFSLPVGSYATSVIREICRYQDQSRTGANTKG